MKIYVDLVLLMNFMFDFMIILTVSILLKRNANINKIIFASFLGSLTIFFLFVKMNTIFIFLIKILVAVIMCIVAFDYKNIKYTLRNISFFYVVSILLGGFIYYLNIKFSYQNNGIIFFHKDLSINYIFIVIFSPVILYIYIRQGNKLKLIYNNIYNFKINYHNKIIENQGFLDTGNKLMYKNIPVILMNRDSFKISKNDKKEIIPVKTISSSDYILGVKVKIIIDSRIKDAYIGLIKEKISIDGASCILNSKLLEG